MSDFMKNKYISLQLCCGALKHLAIMEENEEFELEMSFGDLELDMGE